MLKEHPQLSVQQITNGECRIDIPRLADIFLSQNAVMRYRNTLYIYDTSDGLWYEKSEAEIKRLVCDLLSDKCLSFWTVRVAQNVKEQLDVRIPDFTDNEATYKNLLALNNCIINLYNRKIYQYSPKYFFRVKSRFDYDKNANCPIFRQYLDTVCEKDQPLIMMLEELLGYLLTNQTKIQFIFYFYGSGKNGKSVFLNVIKELVGEGNFITLTPIQIESSFTRASLENKKVLLIGDMSKKDSSNFITAEIKKLSGGDMISAEKKYGSSYQFKPFVKVVASSNFLPDSSNDSTYGAIRRIFLIPFRHQIKGSEQDLSLMDKLKKELPGILNLAINGLHRLVRNNYQFSFDGTNAWQNIISKEYPLRSFINEQFKPTPDEFVPYADIKKAYLGWCQKNYIEYVEPDSKQIYKELLSTYSSVFSSKRNGLRGVRNISLK